MHPFLKYRLSPVLAFSACVGLFVLTCAGAPRVLVESPQSFPQEATGAAAPDDPENQLPRLIGAIDVAYPAELASRAPADRVWVAFVVDNHGRPQKVRAFFGRHAELEQAAVAAVERAAFTPGIHGGRAVSTQMTVLIRFESATASSR